MFREHKTWWAVLSAAGLAIAGILGAGDIPRIAGLYVGLLLWSFVLAGIPWAVRKLFRRPLTSRQFMYTYTVAFLVIVLLNLVAQRDQQSRVAAGDNATDVQDARVVDGLLDEAAVEPGIDQSDRRHSQGDAELKVATQASQVRSGSQFALVQLPYGVSLELPKSWSLIGPDFNAVIETSAEAALDLSGYAVSGSHVNILAATSMPRSTYAAVRITVITPPVLSPAEVASLSPAEVNAVGSEAASGLREVLRRQNLQLLDYLGTAVEMIDSHPALVMSYRRSGPNGPVIVHMYQIFLPERTFRMSLSYRESEAALWQAVMQKIKESVQFDG